MTITYLSPLPLQNFSMASWRSDSDQRHLARLYHQGTICTLAREIGLWTSTLSRLAVRGECGSTIMAPIASPSRSSFSMNGASKSSSTPSLPAWMRAVLNSFSSLARNGCLSRYRRVASALHPGDIASFLLVYLKNVARFLSCVGTWFLRHSKHSPVPTYRFEICPFRQANPVKKWTSPLAFASARTILDISLLMALCGRLFLLFFADSRRAHSEHPPLTKRIAICPCGQGMALKYLVNPAAMASFLVMMFMAQVYLMF